MLEKNNKVSWYLYVVVVLPHPFREMGRGGTPRETQQSGHASRSGPEVKNGRSSAVPKMAHRRGFDAWQSRRRWVRRRIFAFYPA